MKLVKTIHEKWVGKVRFALCLFEDEDGRHVYGVEAGDGPVAMYGTKAEAKRFYGGAGGKR